MSEGSPFEGAGVAEHYEDWYATPFGRIADELESALLRDLLAPLEPPGSILEVGCGTAHFAAGFAAEGYRVVGADRSARMLARACGRVPVVRADAARLPFADGSFDGVFLIALLDFVDDPVAVLREARRVARRRVAVVALAAGSLLAWRRRVAALAGNEVFRAARFLGHRRLLALAGEAGAVPDRVRGALYLPPVLAGRLPGIERRLAGRRWPGAGLVGFGMSAGDGPG